ncbi:MAG TPA: hypothetical protein VFF28_06985 [Candidatus Nanoarchaeia archaeon]|nr:hypothetical protein [Candidatus Nanoarchaeia archaeon]
MKKEILRHRPKMQAWKKVVLLLPALLSASWIIFLKYQQSTYVNEMLAPASTGPLIIALAIFTGGYLVFLMLMFSDSIHDTIWKLLGH